MEAPKRKSEADWQEYLQLEDLVWQSEVRPNGKRGGRFSGEAKRAFLWTWWRLCDGRSQALDLLPAQLGVAVGAADARQAGQRAIETLKAIGLFVERGQRVKGRVTIEVLDPRDVLIGRRARASDGAMLFETDHLEERESPESTPVVCRIGAAPEPPRGDTRAPAQPDSPVEVRVLPPPENGGSAGTSTEKAVEVRVLPPPAAAPGMGGELPREHDLQVLDLDLYVDLSSDLSLVGAPKDFPRAQVASLRDDLSKNGGSAGTSTETAIGDVLSQLLPRLAGRTWLELADELVSLVPGLWPDWACELAREFHGERDAEHGGERTPLVARELGRLILFARKHANRRKPLAVYFTGAVNGWLKEHGRRPIFVAPRKPR